MKTILTSVICFFIFSLSAQHFERLAIGQFPDEHLGGCPTRFGDVNNDQHVDIIVCGKTFINDGNGYFIESVSGMENLRHGSLAVADIDGDGNLDVYLTGWTIENDLYAHMYLNNGQGVFTRVADHGIEATHRGVVAFADVDQDKDPDLLINGYNEDHEKTTTLYINVGQGKFEASSSNSFKKVEEGAVAFADLDGDLDQDLILTGRQNSLYYPTISLLYENDGAGNFTLADDTPFAPSATGSIAIGDVDGDTDLDVLLTAVSQGIDSVHLYINNGQGQFERKKQTNFTEDHNSAASFADIDGDGDLDLFISGEDYFNREFSTLYTNDGSGHFTKVEDTRFVQVANGWNAFADIDGDRDLDLLIAGREVHNRDIIKLYSNDGSGEFQANGILNDGSIRLRDIDGDKRDDILCTDYENIVLFRNTDNYAFAQSEFTFGDRDRLLGGIFIELNGDEQSDIIVAGDENLYTFYNAGNGDFYPGPLFLDTIRYPRPVAVDLDNDSDQDLLIFGEKGYTGRKIYPYVNNGMGNFFPLSSSLTDIEDIGKFELGDLNGDGFLDVVINRSYNDPVSEIYLNDKLGNFYLAADQPLPYEVCYMLKIGDVDADQDMDIFFSNDETAWLFLNDGQGAFVQVQADEFPILRRGGIFFFDPDQDQDQDMLFVGKTWDWASRFDLFINDGSGKFELLDDSPFIDLEDPNAAIGDVNGDGYPDIIVNGQVENTQSRTSYLYLNISATVSTEKVAYDLAPKAFVTPNPSRNSSIMVHYTSEQSQAVQMAIFDAAGKLHHRSTFSALQGTVEIPVHLPSAFAGTYFIQLTSNKEVVHVKCIIHE